MGKGHQLHYSLKLVWNNEATLPVAACTHASCGTPHDKARAQRSSIL